MNKNITIWSLIGFIGTLLFVIAYCPQIIKLLKIKKAEGISIIAYLIWFLGGCLLLIYALTTKDPVFITLTSLETLFLLIINILTFKYRQ